MLRSNLINSLRADAAAVACCFSPPEPPTTMVGQAGVTLASAIAAPCTGVFSANGDSRPDGPWGKALCDAVQLNLASLSLALFDQWPGTAATFSYNRVASIQLFGKPSPTS